MASLARKIGLQARVLAVAIGIAYVLPAGLVAAYRAAGEVPGVSYPEPPIAVRMLGDSSDCPDDDGWSAYDSWR